MDRFLDAVTRPRAAPDRRQDRLPRGRMKPSAHGTSARYVARAGAGRRQESTGDGRNGGVPLECRLIMLWPFNTPREISFLPWQRQDEVRDAARQRYFDDPRTDLRRVAQRLLCGLGWLLLISALPYFGSHITHRGLVHLEQLPQLQRLLLSRTQVTDAGVARLKQALPNVEVTVRRQEPVPTSPPPAGP